jgi:hypothetical protein
MYIIAVEFSTQIVYDCTKSVVAIIAVYAKFLKINQLRYGTGLAHILSGWISRTQHLEVLI